MSHFARYKEFLNDSPSVMGYFQKIVNELFITGKVQDGYRLLYISQLSGIKLWNLLGSLNYKMTPRLGH